MTHADDIRGGAEGVVKAITVHLSVADIEFLERFAANKNYSADANKEKLKQRWSRKSLAESLLTAQVAALRKQRADMEAEIGELPPKKPKEAAVKYAKRANEWLKANPSPARCSVCGQDLKKK